MLTIMNNCNLMVHNITIDVIFIILIYKYVFIYQNINYLNDRRRSDTFILLVLFIMTRFIWEKKHLYQKYI